MDKGLAGRLRARLTVERWLGLADGAGGFDGEGWQVSGQIWAELADATTPIVSEAERRVPRTRVKATTRPCAVDAACRLRWGARVFSVLSVTRDPAAPDRMKLLLEESGA